MDIVKTYGFLILAILFLCGIGAHAQMQGYITSSCERELSVMVPYTESVKVVRFNDSCIVSLYHDNISGSLASHFVFSDYGNNIVRCIDFPGLKIMNLRVYNDTIFFVEKRVQKVLWRVQIPMNCLEVFFIIAR